MASANLDLVRMICGAWERGDYSATEWAHPEIELVFADGPTPGNWKGLVAMGKAWRDFLGTWEEFHQRADEYHELDDERVLAFFRFTGRGKVSGLELEHVHTKAAGLFHLRGGKVTRFVAYADRGRALADLGLSFSSWLTALVVRLPRGIAAMRSLLDCATSGSARDELRLEPEALGSFVGQTSSRLRPR